jgi:hypothetical protein
MSRGIGNLQKLILAYVAEAGGPVTVESMRWQLYEQSNKPVLAEDFLPAKWNTSFARAVSNLASESRSLLRVRKRSLASLEECIAHYPGKTLQASVRQLRRDLLPALREWTQEKDGPWPHYNLSQNEDYFMKRVVPERAKRLRKEWMHLEALMRPLFVPTGSEKLFLLIVKGRSLFQEAEVKSHRSFTEMVDRCCKGDTLPAIIASQLRAFASDFLSATATGSLQLKSFVHEFAHVPRLGQCSLREDTVSALHRLRKSVVESLPGFQPVTHNWFREPKHSVALHKLFDQTIFQKFNFVRIAA